MKQIHRFSLLLLLIIPASPVFSQVKDENPGIGSGTVQQRVKELIDRMSLQDKFWQTFMLYEDLNREKTRYLHGIYGFEGGFTTNTADPAFQIATRVQHGNAEETAGAVNRIQQYFVEQTPLHIPVIIFDEALHGLCKPGATAFPQAIGLAATFDTSLMHRVAAAIAKETRSRGIRQVLSPVINIANDPRWGRTEETYGEDPFLCAEMAVAYVSEFEKQGVVTTPKHFIANLGEGGRDSYPVHFNERLLEEVYFLPFRACIQRGGSRAVMSSYNSLDGTPCSANEWLLMKKLKDEWGFEGVVVSDAGATGGANVLHMTAYDYPEATAKAMNSGQDVIFQTDYEHHSLFQPAYLNGSIRQEVLDKAVSRVLKLKIDLGLFDHPYADPAEAKKWNGNPAHRALALEAARKSIVLLKNEGRMLPLSKEIRSLVIIGPDAVEARLGGYSGPGNNKVNIVEGLKKTLGNKVSINYLPGCGRKAGKYVTIPSAHLSFPKTGINTAGLSAEYFNNPDLSGEPVLVRTDTAVDFRWTLYSPHPSVNYDWFSVRWTGELLSPGTGTYQIGVEGNDGYRLYLDGRLVIDNWQKVSYRSIMQDVSFEAGKKYALKLEFYETTGSVRLRLVWNAGLTDNSIYNTEDAVRAAENSEVTIMVAGIEEGEGFDRASLKLPGNQEELIRRLAETGTGLIVLLCGGSAVTMGDWIGRVPAVLDIWYPGEAGGEAVADVLFGDFNPAGRLPITFPLTEGQLPLYYYHKPTGRNDDYGDMSGEAMFPFGHGLSYTTFSYKDFMIDKPEIAADDSAKVSFTLTNTGLRPGEEVVQLYVKDILASVSRPLRELKGFRRISLQPGESMTVSFLITPEMLSMLDIHLNKVIEPGAFRILVGSSSEEIRLRGTVTVR